MIWIIILIVLIIIWIPLEWIVKPRLEYDKINEQLILWYSISFPATSVWDREFIILYKAK